MDTMVKAVQDAFDAAAKATQDYLTAHPNDWFPCGFAWVVIRPANSKLAKHIKALGKGSPAYGGGLQVWNPSGNNTQVMMAKEAGCRAFQKVLTEAGFDRIYCESRID